MDGFKLLEAIGLELELPVISEQGCSQHNWAAAPALGCSAASLARSMLASTLPCPHASAPLLGADSPTLLHARAALCAAVMSSNGEHTTVMRGVTHGACDFLIKPVRIEELRNIWQHVIRRNRVVVRLGLVGRQAMLEMAPFGCSSAPAAACAATVVAVASFKR